MSYAQAARGSLTHNGLLREVDCQSEVELGRCLDPSEKAVLYSRFPPDIVVRRIHQVCNFSKALSYSQGLNFSSMVMVSCGLCGTFAKGRSSNVTYLQLQHQEMEIVCCMVSYFFQINRM